MISLARETQLAQIKSYFINREDNTHLEIEIYQDEGFFIILKSIKFPMLIPVVSVIQCDSYQKEILLLSTQTILCCRAIQSGNKVEN